MHRELNARQAGLDRIRQIDRWMIAGVVAFTLVFSGAAAQAFKGHQTHPSSSSASGGAAAAPPAPSTDPNASSSDPNASAVPPPDQTQVPAPVPSPVVTASS